MEEKKPIRSFRDLEVYQNTYKAGIEVMTKIIPQLPESEKYDLKDQLARSSKAIPRLIAEGYAKRHQKMGFQNRIDITLCDKLITSYDISGRQLYKLSMSWTKFKKREGF